MTGQEAKDSMIMGNSVRRKHWPSAIYLRPIPETEDYEKHFQDGIFAKYLIDEYDLHENDWEIVP
jgi:hypothetical protein